VHPKRRFSRRSLRRRHIQTDTERILSLVRSKLDEGVYGCKSLTAYRNKIRAVANDNAFWKALAGLERNVKVIGSLFDDLGF
jgi:hypothetical protein